MPKLKLLFVACLGHVSASAVFILLVSLYDRLNGEKEAWPVIGIALIMAFALENLLLIKGLPQKISSIHVSRISLLVLASWLIGLINFLTLGNWADFLPISTPIFSWLLSVLTLFILLLLSAQSQT